MTKKKKPKRGLSGKGGSASPSSSASSQCSGASKQVSSKAPASSSPIKLDLAASIVDGSVDLPVPDLQLESRATVQTSIDAIEPAAKEVSSTPSAPTKAQDSGPQDTSVPSAPATSVANPEPETQADLPTLPSAPATIANNPPQNSIAPPHLPNHRDTPAGHLVESVKGKGIAPPADTNSAIARTSPHLANASLRANEAESSKVNDQMPVSEVESDSSDIPTSDSDTLLYTVWQQRNNMLFNQTLSPPLVAFKDINRQVVNSITALRTRKKFRALMQLWLI
ncbi:hypothetical protein HID58_053262 [Brassica napus]|uniref:Uncharacterized protein n=1 Tax=Brassica napus TaxID=3708 RepID=A0ABQ8AEK6_BRANA|nr:hypothetical protein HID58_053262 [Brassica napus]